MSDPTILVLASLADGEKHGYAMMEDIKRFDGIALRQLSDRALAQHRLEVDPAGGVERSAAAV